MLILIGSYSSVEAIILAAGDGVCKFTSVNCRETSCFFTVPGYTGEERALSVRALARGFTVYNFYVGTKVACLSASS